MKFYMQSIQKYFQMVTFLVALKLNSQDSQQRTSYVCSISLVKISPFAIITLSVQNSLVIS